MVVRGPQDTTTYETRFTYLNNRMRTRAVVRRDLSPGKLATTTYTFGNNARLTSVAVPYDTVSGGRTATTTFASWDEKGLAALALTDTTYGLTSRVDGPISGTRDAADFWLDRFGAPTRIVGLGLNDTTLVYRDSVANPGLVTRVRYPNQRWVRMSWSSRGNLAEIRDSTTQVPGGALPTKVTSYSYLDLNAPDSPSRIQDALGQHSDFSYDSLALDTLAVDPRGHRTRFYNRVNSGDTLRGLVDSVSERNVVTWIEAAEAESLRTLTTRFHYDSTTGNLQWVKSPLGVITSYRMDAAGNVTDAVDPMRNRSVFAYDLWDRVTEVDHVATRSTTYPTFNPLAACDRLQILCSDSLAAGGGTELEHYSLNAAGLDSTYDARAVRRRFRLDGRGSVWRETDELLHHRTAFYNAFGAVDSTRSRAGFTVKYFYDGMGRLLTRLWPSVPDPFTHPADSVLSDTVSYAYDILGNVLSARDRWGRITRTYYGDNSVKTRVTTAGGTDSLWYFYDATGARTKVIHWTAAGARDSVLYSYNSAGDLSRLTAYFGAPLATVDTFTFEWDSLGRRRKVTYPRGPTVSFAYDGGGTLRRILGTGTGRFDFSLRTPTVDPAGNIRLEQVACHLLISDTLSSGSPCNGVGPLNTTTTFNRLGEVIKQIRSFPLPATTDSMTYDLSGNLVFRRRTTGSSSDSRWTIGSGTNQMVKEQVVGDSFGYTLDGSRRLGFVGSQYTEKYWYDALNRTSGIATTGVTTYLGPNSCLYDPDGQLFKPCDNGAPDLAFDGNNVVAALADEWRFASGPGLDDPLAGLLRPPPARAGTSISSPTAGAGNWW